MLSSKLNTQPPQKSIDFFSELSKIIQSTTPSTTPNSVINASSTSEPSNVIISTPSHDNICLISKEPLHPNHITFTCNHKFNYMPIYKEILYQKTKSNTLYEVTKLNSNQMKCPYCRTITNKLLPFIPYPSVKLAKNIHSSDNNCISTAKCSHVIKKRDGDTHCETKCHKNALYYEAENLLFCPTHYKQYVAKNSCATPLKVKNKKTVKVNSDKPRCTAILKSGTNIGKPCNSVISIDGSQFCKKHSH
jgi:hypothetical protein